MNGWKNWLKASLVRAVKTAAQTAVATIGVSAAMSDVDWIFVGSASLLAAILSVLTSLAGLPELDDADQPKALMAADTDFDTDTDFDSDTDTE